MAETTDMAPTRRKASTRGAAARSKAKEAQLEEQISQLQDDIKSIAATLGRLSNEKVSEVKGIAKSEALNLQRQGQHVVEDLQEKTEDLEKQLKDTIRERPLTAVASAIGIGFVLALLSRH